MRDVSSKSHSWNVQLSGLHGRTNRSQEEAGAADREPMPSFKLHELFYQFGNPGRNKDEAKRNARSYRLPLHRAARFCAEPTAIGSENVAVSKGNAPFVSP